MARKCSRATPRRAAARRRIAPEESAARLRAIVETAVEGIITIDEQGRIDSFNRAAERLFGYTPKEVLGRDVSLLMPSPHREAHGGYLRQYLRTGQAKIIGLGREVIGRRKDGSLFPLDLSVGEVRLPGGRLFTGILRDITVRKQAEARLEELTRSLAEKNQELEAIVYAASHDLRSPLINVQGFSSELSAACAQVRRHWETLPAAVGKAPAVARLLEQDIPEALGYVQASVRRIDALLNGLLRFSRLGRAALRIEPLALDELMDGIRQGMEFQLQQARARLVVAPLPACQADAAQLGRVFSNLLENAVKYLEPARPGLITVTGQVEGERAVYCVQDNGLGIPPEHQEKVFEVFHRVNPAAGEGEGLGLAMARRILGRLGGRIWLTSTPGQGSAFFLSLPKA